MLNSGCILFLQNNTSNFFCESIKFFLHHVAFILKVYVVGFLKNAIEVEIDIFNSHFGVRPCPQS